MDGEALEHRVGRGLDAAAPEDRQERIRQPGLPVDQGAVAVERERLEAPEIAEAAIDHGRIVSRRRNARTAPTVGGA